MFSKVLIANRGEIAYRIFRTAKRLGISCVAVYSEADRHAHYVRLADEAYFLGPSPASESYLNQTKIIEIAERAKVEAIHPGYGFLSENPKFADACFEKNICFIGPPVKALIAMGSKSAAKTMMQAAGIPVVRGYHGDNQEVTFLLKKADEIGYPILIKAAAGGGGKGMRVVQSKQGLREALEGAKREALKAFGNDTVILESYLTSPRHIEVQIFVDQYGNAVHLFERDCSIQRRHQKIIEEAPATRFSEALREQMTSCALLAACTVGYVGAGTIEFLVQDEQFYFMEMNTRLQVEHPVTEKITGIDLVEWQFRIASGEMLPLPQAQILCKGHAIEARICAEDPEKNFLPSVGTVSFLRTPPEDAHIRLDTGIIVGDVITTYYDSMLSKLIAWGENRSQAIQQLLQGLFQYRLIGVTTNLDLLKRILKQPEFIEANFHTDFVETHLEKLLTKGKVSEIAVIAAAIYAVTQQKYEAQECALKTSDPYSPWALADNWRLNAIAPQTLWFEYRNSPIELQVTATGNAFNVLYNGKQYFVKAVVCNDCITLQMLNQEHWVEVIAYQGDLYLFLENETIVFSPYRESFYEHADSDAHLVAPLPGTIVALFVKEGDSVEAGDRLAVIEAMKMEHTIRAPSKGFVKAWHFKVGDLVSEGAELLAFEAIKE